MQKVKLLHWCIGFNHALVFFSESQLNVFINPSLQVNLVTQYSLRFKNVIIKAKVYQL